MYTSFESHLLVETAGMLKLKIRQLNGFHVSLSLLYTYITTSAV